MIKLASWNVNSLKVRLEQVLQWLQTSDIDILALQETKVTDDQFPVEAFHSLGYEVVFSGQKTYNGVAIVSRQPMQDIVTDIPNLADPQRRILAATIGKLRLINLYVPNGSAVDSEKYQYKLSWLNAVTDFIREALSTHTEVAVVGDFNIAPSDLDVHDPTAWAGQVLVSPLEREALRDILELGLQDCFRHLHPDAPTYSWWDYRAASFRRNRGLRIDLILLSQALMRRCEACDIDSAPRRLERPSDHAPVQIRLAVN